ncbi:MAG: glycosyl transferase, family 9 [Phycisphaerales bacterium]|nr:glycosyl transferase, family 9 [Phycisphaerales bacterium]
MITLLVRQQMMGVRAILPEWVRVMPLPFDPRQHVGGRQNEIAEKLRAFAGECRADLAVVAEYNRTWASEIVATLSGAARVMAFNGPTGLNLDHRDIVAGAVGDGSQANWQLVGAVSEERESTKYAKFLSALGLDAIVPEIVIRDEDRQRARTVWQETGATPEQAIVCFPGSGEQLVRSLDPQTWAKWIAHLNARRPLVLLGGMADSPVLDAIAACGLPENVRRILIPNEDTGLLAAVLEKAGAYVGMDTGPMHVAAVLGPPTLGIFGGGHCAERFLPVGRRAAAIRMPLGCYGCEWNCPFDSRLCIKNIPLAKLIETGDAFLDGLENADPFSPRVFEIETPADLPAAVLGPVMRQHHWFCKLNHENNEHHAYLADVLARMTEANNQRDRQIRELNDALADAGLGNQTTIATIRRHLSKAGKRLWK